jgi:uncharacterized low-complexity protein
MKKIVALFTAVMFAMTLGVAFAQEKAAAPTPTEKKAEEKASKKKSKQEKKAAKKKAADEKKAADLKAGEKKEASDLKASEKAAK